MSSATAATATSISDLLVVELGARIGVAVCGSLLSQLGADVALIEPRHRITHYKWHSRAASAAGKRAIALDPGRAADKTLLADLLSAADVVLLSSDICARPEHAWRRDQIVCDITAFGDSGPLCATAYSDALVQAVSGIADTTGDPNGPPTPVGLPILEFSAGLYAAAAVVIALRVRRLTGLGQSIDIAMFDCALSALATFLPFHIVGESMSRAGNRHTLAAPWNAYRAVDGWVLICTATDDQWQRLCTAMEAPELARRFATNTERVAKRAEVDAVVEQWVGQQEVRSCVERLSALGIACGPIVTIEALREEPNLAYRQMVLYLTDPESGKTLALPGSPLKASRTPGRSPARIPAVDQDRAYIASLCKRKKPLLTPCAQPSAAPRPLAGVRVIEIGQYTTAPLVARQLGALGAEVLKIEPPGGEGARGWPPTHGDQGYFFSFSNSDKKSLMIDLREHDDKARFTKLLKSADVLVENLKPGSLERLGFGPREIEAINPRLVYCGISGFGAVSAYPQRPAFDTVVQAMSGFMDLTRSAGTPMKAGISAADIVGGELSLVAILAALEYRDATQLGQHLDVSMQDAAVWVTQMAWNRGPLLERVTIVACSDGYAMLLGDEAQAAAQLAACEPGFSLGNASARSLSRAALLALAQRAGVAAAPVLSVAEAAESAQARDRQAIIYGCDRRGTRWPLLNSPLRLKMTPSIVASVIGQLGEANDEILANL